ncbi:MAG TPA: leucine--tRNA ligase [Bacilli bacterium]|nr:leucine--tRNA ligase [Bacilli bacterium]
MYNFKEIEKKWQDYWYTNKVFYANNNSDKPKYYVLIEFPYPSGIGIHMGHPKSHAALDSLARKRRMQGYNVLYPIGFDAFGLPAENYAIKNKMHPKDAVVQNIKNMTSQIKSLGISFDWDRAFSTTDPDYYKWTQWQFLKFYEHGLAYKAKIPINWCPSCKTGLANEDVESGKCERCGSEVYKKEKEQWMLKMQSYSEKLLEGLDDTKFIDRVKTAQINWIGKSEGAIVDFKIKGYNDVLNVFTTRCDTLYGVTFMVLAPEHDLVKKITTDSNRKEVEEYIINASKLSDIDRSNIVKEKTGVFTGAYAINPVNNEEIPIYISDYVMLGYGTGAIMAVPAHDQRDYDFAKKYNIPIIEVIKGGDISKEAYTGDGEMINSGILNGIDNKKDSINRMLEYLKEKNIGKKEITYKMQDWIFSRQRFWGEPIPMIYCDDCGWVPVPFEDLPVQLPDITSYEVTDTGESPLANIPSWYEVPCPKCGKKARRETDTMPNWAGSSWYWLRYMDPHNDKEFASQEALKYWGKVDWYNGGMEHATRHLLYARFWNRFLYDIGLVPNKEPFEIRSAHGMVLGSDGEKMSKSKGNGVNPMDVINEYGADALRVYQLFIGDFEQDAIWNNDGLKGCFRFLNRVWDIKDKLNDSNEYSKDIESLIHKTIKKVDNDIETMKYNTAISALMILLNAMDKLNNISRKDLRTFITLLNPFAPHITEEINSIYKLGEELSYTKWPEYDESKTKDDVYEMVIQINGKLRARENVEIGTSKEKMIDKAFINDKIIELLKDKEIIKKIAIQDKLVNIVIK